MARRSLSLVALVAFTGLACAGIQGKPVPSDRLDLVGTWTASGVTLVVTPGGEVVYEREGDIGHLKIEGPVTEWTGDGFFVGVFGVGRSFRVDQEPQHVGDHWETTIDGDVLRRPGLPPAEKVPERRGDGRKKRREP